MSDRTTARRVRALRVAVQLPNRLLREALAGHVSRMPDLHLVGTARLGAELRDLCELRRPDVVVFEAEGCADAPGTRLVCDLRARFRDLHLIGLYSTPDPDTSVRLQQAGADRLMSYSSGLEALLAAVRHPLCAQAAPQPQKPAISDRDQRILHLISAGHTLEQISADLGLTPRAVEGHKRRIFAKLDARSQVHAASRAVRLGLLPGVREVPAPPDLASGHPTLALVRGRRGELVTRVAELLVARGLPVLVEYGERARHGENPARHQRGLTVTVLVDPQPSDWRLLQTLPTRGMVVVSGELDQAGMADAVQRGAHAVIPAAELAGTLAAAFELAARGYFVADADQVRRLTDAGMVRLAGRRPIVPLELTRREREILESVAAGHSVKQTARTLGIRVKTVESLQSRLFRKLGVRGRAAALVVAYGLGLLPPQEGGERSGDCISVEPVER